MKKLVLGSAIAAMIAAPAIAADMPVKAPPPPPVVYDWSGAYVGFNAGGMWYDVQRDYPYTGLGFLTGGGVGNHTLSGDDGIYGFHAGFQGQWGAWVLGVEAAYTGCFRECRADLAVGVAQGFAPNTISQTKITNLFTVGPRLGYAWDRWMIFGTGGAAVATLKDQYCSAVTGLCGPVVNPIFNGATHNWGWYAGGGFEYMVHKGALVDVILGVEYQHWDVDTKDAACFSPGCNPRSGGDDTLSASGDLVRARLTIKTQGWGWTGPWSTAPVAAKY